MKQLSVIPDRHFLAFLVALMRYINSRFTYLLKNMPFVVNKLTPMAIDDKTVAITCMMHHISMNEAHLCSMCRYIMVVPWRVCDAVE